MDFHFHLFKVMNWTLFFPNVPHPAAIKDNDKLLLTKTGEGLAFYQGEILIKTEE